MKFYSTNSIRSVALFQYFSGGANILNEPSFFYFLYYIYDFNYKIILIDKKNYKFQEQYFSKKILKKET